MDDCVYGTWVTLIDRGARDPREAIERALTGVRVDPDTVDRIRDDYVDAINESLPPGVSLLHDEFVGPVDQWGYGSRVAIADAVHGVDLWGIVFRHMP